MTCPHHNFTIYSTEARRAQIITTTQFKHCLDCGVTHKVGGDRARAIPTGIGRESHSDIIRAAIARKRGRPRRELPARP